MSIVDPHIASAGGASGQEDQALEGVAAYCPHCSAPVGDGVFPWPPDPTRCPTCGQWIGRNRASGQPVEVAEVADDEDGGHAERRGPMSFLLGRRAHEVEEARPEAAADETQWPPDAYDMPPPAPSERVDQPSSVPIDDTPPKGDPAAGPAARPERGGGLAGRLRTFGSRVRDELLPAAKPRGAEAARGDEEPTAVEEPAALDDEAPLAVEDPGVPEVLDEPEPEAAEVQEPLAAEDAQEPDAQPEPVEEPSADAEAVEEPEEIAAEDQGEPVEDEAEDEAEEEPAAEAEVDEPVAPEEEAKPTAEPDEAELPAAEAEPPEAEAPAAAPADERELDLRTVAARVAVSRMAGGAEPKPSRIPALPIPGKLQPPRIARPRIRPAAARRPAPKPGPIQEGATRKRQPVRITGITMVVVGLLILAYGTVTLVWQDPWTAWQAARAQDRAKVQFQKIVRDFRKSAKNQTKVATRDWLHRQAALFNLNTPEGDPVGRLSIPKIGIKFTIVQGTEETTLQKGPAHYVETPLPGAKGKWTVGIAGHRTTYLAPFRHIDQLDPGDKIYITMPYGRFYYAVEKTKIVPAAEQTALAADNNITGRKPYNRLALTACHPPFSAAERIIVYSRLMHYKVNKPQS